MKTLLISSALVACTAGAATAQITFATGRVDASYFQYSNNPGVYAYNLTGRAAVNIGQFGVQVDVANTSRVFSGLSFDQYSAGLHAYKNLGNDGKFGVFAQRDRIDIFGLANNTNSAGVEAMMGFGAFNIEAAVGAARSSRSSTTYWVADIDAYYAISPSLEANIGALWFLSSNDPYYNIGLTYSPSSLPVSISASFTARAGLDDTYGINVSYSFGPSADERLFSTRETPIYLP